MIALTRQDKEKLVLELYSQGKTYRQIAEEARICPRDIKTIVEKPIKERESMESMSVSSQAYKLFSGGKTLAEVSIALNLREPDVTKFYMEYCKLTQLDSFYRIYDKIKDDINPLVNLYILSKVARMDTQQVVRLLTIANNDLPSVEYRYKKLKREEASLKAGNQNSARTFQELSDLISNTRNTLEQYDLSCKERRLEMDNLNKEYTRLKAFVNDFQNNNEEYIKIIKTVEEKVLGVLSNAKVLLMYALLSITESIRNDPERFRSIFYNMSSITDYNSNISEYSTASYMYGPPPPTPQRSSSPDYNTEANAAIIVDEAEKLYNKLVKDSINKIIIDYPFGKSSLPLLPSNEKQSCFQKTNSSL
jgi:hypothetical protein